MLNPITKEYYLHPFAFTFEIQQNSIKFMATPIYISGRNKAIKYYLLYKENAIYKLKQNLWSKKILAIIFVLLFIIGNSAITAHYLTIFSFELKNDMFSYLGFIILSISGITIINARWIKIVAEKYADRFWKNTL